jgi:hypothetical protein
LLVVEKKTVLSTFTLMGRMCMKVDFCCHSVQLILLDDNGNTSVNEKGILEHVFMGKFGNVVHATRESKKFHSH